MLTLYEWLIKVNKNFVVEIKNIYMQHCSIWNQGEAKNKNLLFFTNFKQKSVYFLIFSG